MTLCASVLQHSLKHPLILLGSLMTSSTMQLERLEAVQKPNPRSPRRSMMSLFLQAEVGPA